jgi:hypothetical protein
VTRAATRHAIGASRKLHVFNFLAEGYTGHDVSSLVPRDGVNDQLRRLDGRLLIFVTLAPKPRSLAPRIGGVERVRNSRRATSPPRRAAGPKRRPPQHRG